MADYLKFLRNVESYLILVHDMADNIDQEELDKRIHQYSEIENRSYQEVKEFVLGLLWAEQDELKTSEVVTLVEKWLGI